MVWKHFYFSMPTQCQNLKNMYVALCYLKCNTKSFHCFNFFTIFLKKLLYEWGVCYRSSMTEHYSASKLSVCISSDQDLHFDGPSTSVTHFVHSVRFFKVCLFFFSQTVFLLLVLLIFQPKSKNKQTLTLVWVCFQWSQ